MTTTAHRLSLAVAGALLGFGFGAFAATQHYRYELDVECGFYSFREPLTLIQTIGRHYDVETDALGRMQRVSVVQDGKKISERLFQYTGERKLPDSFETFANGERTGIVKLQFTDGGCLKRLDFMTVHNVLTGYVTNSASPGKVEQHYIDVSGLEKFRAVLHFNEQGILVRKEVPPNPDVAASFNVGYDPNTGQELFRKQFRDGELELTSTNEYESDGNLVRRDVYDKSGHLYGVEEYSGGLATKRVFHHSADDTVEYRYSYNLERQVDKTKVYHNGKFVCSLVYERFSNGVPMRTKALSPEGELWADYPNQQVTMIDRSGEHGGGTNNVIYKKGLWW